MKTISRHPVLYSPLSKTDRTQLLHSCFRVHLSSSHTCCFTKKEARSQKLITWNYTTWNVIRDCKSTKTEHSKKRTTSLPTWTMIYWLKQRQSITSHHPQQLFHCTHYQGLKPASSVQTRLSTMSLRKDQPHLCSNCSLVDCSAIFMLS